LVKANDRVTSGGMTVGVYRVKCGVKNSAGESVMYFAKTFGDYFAIDGVGLPPPPNETTVNAITHPGVSGNDGNVWYWATRGCGADNEHKVNLNNYLPVTSIRTSLLANNQLYDVIVTVEDHDGNEATSTIKLYVDNKARKNVLGRKG
jgi:hypothetical protein